MFTCIEHHSGTNKQYVHTPRQPNHIITSDMGDQLYHDVIKYRTIKPMKASKYSHTFQMHEKRGSFQVVDSVDVHDFGNFGYCSVLMDQSESISVKYCPDINPLLDYLDKDGYLGSNTVQAIRDRVMIRGSSDDGIEKYVEGATYVGLEDSIHMQHEIGEDNGI